MSGPAAFRELLTRRDFAVRFERVAHAIELRRVHFLEALVTGRPGTTLERSEVLLGCVRRKGAEVEFDRASVGAALASARLSEGEPRIALNVLAVTLAADFEFPRFLADSAQENGIAPERLVLELADDVSGRRQSELLESIARLRAIGVRIALDDVGSGLSNYKMMLDCRPHYFKIGAYFVRGAGRDSYRLALLRSLVELGVRLGAQVVATGVDSSADLDAVHGVGVTLVQGTVCRGAALLPKAEAPALAVVA
jgi:EAL domain-containing protein (putative c-di-GMP-specific phosphodiesterase class I)